MSDELIFITRTRNARCANGASQDVTVKTIKNNNSICPRFIFRNECWKLICRDSEYITICVFNNRIYFKSCCENEGIKITETASRNRYLYFKNEYLEMVTPFFGDYGLKYDSERELYYIQK